jgi:hypothetical protein
MFIWAVLTIDWEMKNNAARHRNFVFILVSPFALACAGIFNITKHDILQNVTNPTVNLSSSHHGLNSMFFTCIVNDTAESGQML